MGKFGLKIAKLFGNKLPKFASQSDAEHELYTFRDSRLHRLNSLASNYDAFEPDASPESLKILEKWYFELWEANDFKSINTNLKEFEECMAMYFGHVLVKNITDAEWIVSEFAFEKDKYEIGVKYDLASVMLGRFTDHFKTPNNKHRQSLWRRYKKYCM